MAKLLVHPQSGDRLVILTSATESAGASFRFELVSEAAGDEGEAPEDHVHPLQEERIEVLSGALRCRIAGREQLLREGAVLTIPPGTPHAVWNAARVATRSRGEFRPALDMQERFEASFRRTRATRRAV
ncbi:MAG: cupin domain-containing protein [Thermodesulfobacteriota bacterium]